MAQTVGLVVAGASSGLGRGICEQLVRSLLADGCSVRCFIAARRKEKLLELRDELLALAGEGGGPTVEVQCDAVDLADVAATSAYGSVLRRALLPASAAADGQEAPSAIKEVLVVMAAGKHEAAAIQEGETWRYSEAKDFDVAEKKAMNCLVGRSPVLLYRELASWSAMGRSAVPSRTFLFLSSQAVDEQWWPKGNSLYGPAKLKAEKDLLEAEDRRPSGMPRLVMARFPLVATDMAEQLYTELLPVEPAFHVGESLSGLAKTRGELFLPLLPACEETARLALCAMREADFASLAPTWVACKEEGGVGRHAFAYSGAPSAQ